MPKPKLSEEIVTMVVELLLGGWTPQDIVAGWPSTECPSLGAIQRIAKQHGLARKQGGGAPGRKSPGSGRGGGAPKGHAPYVGSGRPRGPGKKTSPHRDEVRRLRAEGHSLRVIAELVGLRSPQQVANLLSDG